MRPFLALCTALFATAALAAAAPQAGTPGVGAPVPAAGALPPGPGQTQVQTACSACHAVGIVMGQRHTAKQWDELVGQMVDRGAQVSDADLPIVVAYLAKNYPAN